MRSSTDGRDQGQGTTPVTSPLRAEMIVAPEALERLREPWLELLERSEAEQVTLSPDWLLPWWAIFGSLGRRRLAICLFWEGGTLVGLAPLLHRWRLASTGLPFARVELLGTGEPEEDEIASDYVGVVAARGFEAAVAEALADIVTGGSAGRAAGLSRWDELTLTALDGTLSMPALLQGALTRRGLPATLVTEGTAPHIPLPPTFEAYLAALSSQNRYFARRAQRDFDTWSGGDVRHERAETPGDLARGLEVLQSLHAERWRGAGRSGVFASPRFEAFHRAVMPALLKTGALDLRWMTVRGQPVAAAYGLVSRNRVQFYQGGRAMGVPQSARVGIALHLHVIRSAIAEGRTEYDFLAGRSQYKRQLSLAERPIARLVIERPGWRRRAHDTATRAVRWWRARRGAVATQDRPPAAPSVDDEIQRR